MATALAAGATGGVAHAATASRADGVDQLSAQAGFSPVETWAAQEPGTIAESSPMPATIDGVPAVVVGAQNGQVYAVSLRTGATLPGWPVTTPGAQPVDSTPSVNGSLIYVGTGDAATPHGGGYLALRSNGSVAWYRQVSLLPGGGGGASGVQASMAVGMLNHRMSVTAGSLGEMTSAFRSSNGATRPGFPWFGSDTTFATPAIANLYGNGTDFIVQGAEQTGGLAYGRLYHNGGHIRVLRATGNAGTSSPAGGLVCDFTPNQGVQSSPAVGRFLHNNAVGIVAGTGNDFAGVSDTGALFALNSHCGLQWRAVLNGETQSSPALVDALGNNHLQVAEGTGNGFVYLMNGSNGRPYWVAHMPLGMIIGSIVSADLGGGHQDLLVPTTSGLYVLDGRTGGQLALLGQGMLGLQSSPLVTRDANGAVGITLAGYDGAGGLIVHFDLQGTNGNLVTEAGAWPMFHHDVHLTGSTLSPGRR